MAAIITRPLEPKDWPLIERLFGDNGACGGCWCMYWRAPSTGKYWEEHKGARNRVDFEALVRSGRATGILAFDAATPIGWCSIAPRNDFAYLARARKIPPAISDKTWSITCFFIDRSSRNSGVASKLVTAAVDYARGRNATYVESYPVTPKSAGTKIPDAFAHTGLPSLFEAAGFTAVASAGARIVYRISLQ